MSPVMSGLAVSVALKSSRLAAAPQLPAACFSAWQARSHTADDGPRLAQLPKDTLPARPYAELVQFSGGKPKPGSPSPDSLGLPCRLCRVHQIRQPHLVRPPTARSAIDTDD